MHLVSHHMLKSLIVGWSQKYENLLLFTSEAIVHNLITVSLVTQVMKLASDIRDLLPTEGSGISSSAIK